MSRKNVNLVFPKIWGFEHYLYRCDLQGVYRNQPQRIGIIINQVI